MSAQYNTIQNTIPIAESVAVAAAAFIFFVLGLADPVGTRGITKRNEPRAPDERGPLNPHRRHLPGAGRAPVAKPVERYRLQSSLLIRDKDHDAVAVVATVEFNRL
jgi:hypothetical protein